MSSLRRLKRQQQHQRPPALDQLSKSLKALEQVGGLQQSLENIQELDKLVRETHALVGTIVEDCQTLATENEVQREVFIRLLVALSGDPEQHIRKVEETLRERLLAEREGS